MDDNFMSICMKDNIQAVRAMLVRILGRDDINITRVETQKVLRGFGRSVTLDVYAEDGRYTIYNEEIQNDSRGATPKRARFHCGMLDAHFLKEGQSFEELPESWVIFITRHDVLKLGKPVYTINRCIEGTGEPFKDSQHIVYVNCSAKDDGSEVWKVIHDMTCRKQAEMLIPELAETVSRFKGNKRKEEISMNMREFFKDYIDAREEAAEAKGKAEFITALLKAGATTVDKIAEALGLSIEEVQALANTHEHNS